MAYPVTITTFTLITVEIGLNSDIKKLMKTFLSAPEVLPAALPDVYRSVELKNTGNLQEIDIQIEYAPELPIDSEVDRVDKLNLDDVKASYTVIGGSYLKYYKSYEGTVQLAEDKSTGGTKAIRTYKIETEKGSPDFNKFIEFDINVLKMIDNIKI